MAAQGEKRKFPGPAGSLPLLMAKTSSKKPHRFAHQMYSIPSQLPVKEDRPEISIFQRQTWKELRKALGLEVGGQNGILDIMNIEWVRTKAKRFPVSLKIPFLAVALQESPEILPEKDGKFKPPSVKLTDPSGVILAALDTKFVAAYSSQLRLGTCLALQNVGLLHFKRQLILTVTLKNIILMTSYADNAFQNIHADHTPSSDVQLSSFCDFSYEAIAANYKQLVNVKKKAQDGILEPDKNKTPPPLNGNGRESVVMSTSVPLATAENPFSSFDDDDEFLKVLADFEFP